MKRLEMLYFSPCLNSQSQRELQQNLDDIFGDRPLDEWNYGLDLTKLLTGMPGAVFSESKSFLLLFCIARSLELVTKKPSLVLRVYPPVIQIPKRTLPGSPQTLLGNNQQIKMPPNVHIKLSVIELHRNPNSWASWTSRANSHVLSSDSAKDLGEFQPRRWLATTKEKSDEVPPSIIDPFRPQASSSPKPGAYLPFSEGSRSCIGRRFAQVEMVLTLAVIFKYWAIKLVPEPPVDEDDKGRTSSTNELPDDAFIQNAISTAEKKSTWLQARKRLRREIWDNLGYVLTLEV